MRWNSISCSILLEKVYSVLYSIAHFQIVFLWKLTKHLYLTSETMSEGVNSRINKISVGDHLTNYWHLWIFTSFRPELFFSRNLISQSVSFFFGLTLLLIILVYYLWEHKIKIKTIGQNLLDQLVIEITPL